MYCLALNRNLSMSLIRPLSLPILTVQLFCHTIHSIVENLKLFFIRKLHCELGGQRGQQEVNLTRRAQSVTLCAARYAFTCHIDPPK